MKKRRRDLSRDAVFVCVLRTLERLRRSHRQMRFRIRRCGDDEACARAGVGRLVAAAHAVPGEGHNDSQRVCRAADDERRWRAELAIARPGVGEYEKGERGVQQHRCARKRCKHARTVQRNARDQPIADMARNDDDRQQCKIRDEIEQKIGHIHEMKAPRIAVLRERLPALMDSGRARRRRSLHVFVSQ
ncbi:hypothetical protein JNB89_17785 [Paraburkholderia phenoliruptrix]|nr:hypothetical protein [Paraburkholderia phenoliruptrix]MBW9130219.1 hypothetical protein [Paraburkholderia ginsengiterrae]